MLFGRDYRVAISGGWNVVSVKALSTSQSVGQLIAPTGTISTYNTFRTGFFLSLTYSFSISPSTQSAATGSPTSTGAGGGAGPGAGGGGGGAGGGKPGGATPGVTTPSGN
jgi:hypothetical protein